MTLSNLLRLENYQSFSLLQDAFKLLKWFHDQDKPSWYGSLQQLLNMYQSFVILYRGKISKETLQTIAVWLRGSWGWNPFPFWLHIVLTLIKRETTNTYITSYLYCVTTSFFLNEVDKHMADDIWRNVDIKRFEQVYPVTM